jgi:hypothetical protein
MLKSIILALFINITIFNYTVFSMINEEAEQNELNLCHGRFREGIPEELTVIQTRAMFKNDGFFVNEILIENEDEIVKSRKFKPTCIDGSVKFLESLANFEIIKGIWIKCDNAWLFSRAYAADQGIMFTVREKK